MKLATPASLSRGGASLRRISWLASTSSAQRSEKSSLSIWSLESK